MPDILSDDLSLHVEATEVDPKITVVRAAGEVDMLTAPRLRDEVDKHLRPGRGLVLDLNEVTFFATAGLSMLIDTQLRAEADGVGWALLAGRRSVTRPLEMTGVASRLPIRASLAEAIDALAEHVPG